jgi:hypothetical protein
VRVAFVPDDYNAIPHHHKAFGTVKQNRLLAEGNPSFDIDPALEVRAGDIVVRKTRFGSRTRSQTKDLRRCARDRQVSVAAVARARHINVVSIWTIPQLLPATCSRWCAPAPITTTPAIDLSAQGIRDDDRRAAAHTVWGHGLHEPAMHLERQTYFGEISWPREGSAGVLLDSA